MIRFVTLLLFLTCAVRAEEEARFKPKTYVPSKPALNRSYEASEYLPSKNAFSATFTSRKGTEPARRGFWNLFKAKPAEAPSKLADAATADAKPYTQSQQITVPTMTPDRKAINMDEHKPYVEGENKLQAAGYQAPDKPREKNPLLAPRQGIKEHP